MYTPNFISLPSLFRSRSTKLSDRKVSIGPCYFSIVQSQQKHSRVAPECCCDWWKSCSSTVLWKWGKISPATERSETCGFTLAPQIGPATRNEWISQPSWKRPTTVRWESADHGDLLLEWGIINGWKSQGLWEGENPNYLKLLLLVILLLFYLL